MMFIICMTIAAVVFLFDIRDLVREEISEHKDNRDKQHADNDL